jgi:hypothetical protein
MALAQRKKVGRNAAPHSSATQTYVYTKRKRTEQNVVGDLHLYARYAHRRRDKPAHESISLARGKGSESSVLHIPIPLFLFMIVVFLHIHLFISIVAFYSYTHTPCLACFGRRFSNAGYHPKRCICAPLQLIMSCYQHRTVPFSANKRKAYLVTWSTGAGLLLSLAPLPWPVWPALGASPAPEAFMPSRAAAG